MTARRDLLRTAGGGAAALASVAAGAAFARVVGAAPPAPVSAIPDADVLALAERFHREYRRYVKLMHRCERISEEAEADPACPERIVTPIENPAGYERFRAFMRARGCSAAWEAWNEAYATAAASAEALFVVRARTPAGMLAKARVLAVAHGDNDQGGSTDLMVRVPDWFASLVADLEAMTSAGGAA